VAYDFALMRVSEFVELPVLEISAFIANFDLWVIDDGHALAGELLVLATGVDEPSSCNA
jgi:hypothetical protein